MTPDDLADMFIELLRGPKGKAIAEMVVARATTTGRRPRHAPDLGQILDAVSAELGVTREQLVGKSTKRPISRARNLAAYIAHQVTEASFTEIGRQLGGRDHSTVIPGIRGITALLAAGNADLIAAERRVLERLGNGVGRRKVEDDECESLPRAI